MLYLELAIVTLLIVINGLLSMSELAIVSSRPARLAGLVEKGVRGSRRALALASDPGKFLSTVQIGITLIGVLSGAFSGATLGQRLSLWLVELGLSQGLSETIGVGLVVGIITYASLIVGELVPKQIALRDPESIAVKVAPAMNVMAKISLPLVWLLDYSGKALLWLLGHRGEAEERVSEEEIHTLVMEAEHAGVLEPGEKEMIAGVMRLGDLPVGAVMTPRNEVSQIDLADPLPVILANLQKTNHSRSVVFDGDRDSALGIVQAKDLLDVYLAGQTPDIRELTREAPIIPETLDARDVVAILRDSPVHIGLVHDEYGVFQGVVTSADILEAIVGSFQTEHGPAEPAYVKRDDGSYLISGWMPALEFADLLGIAFAAVAALPDLCRLPLAGIRRHPRGRRQDHGWRLAVRNRRHGWPAHRQGAGEQARENMILQSLAGYVSSRHASGGTRLRRLLITPALQFPLQDIGGCRAIDMSD